jgi:two-component system, OmpR family, response regulator RstA
MPEREKILLIDDDVELCQLISQYLGSNGYQVSCHHSGADAEQVILAQQPDLLILDLMLPGNDGLTICKAVRAKLHCPIIMMTALDDDIDEVTGLEVGADDYLAKPVKPRVLLAHIRAQLRRLLPATQSTTELRFCYDQQIQLDARKRTVTMQQQLIDFSSAEFDLLWLLAEQVGSIISRDELYQQILRLPYDGLDRTIDLRISRIRKKLNDNPKQPFIIKTIRNAGYLLTP